MRTLIYPESAYVQARKDARMLGVVIEEKSCITYAGESRCIDAYDFDGTRVSRHILCDIEYEEAAYNDRGI